MFTYTLENPLNAALSAAPMAMAASNGLLWAPNSDPATRTVASDGSKHLNALQHAHVSAFLVVTGSGAVGTEAGFSVAQAFGNFRERKVTEDSSIGLQKDSWRDQWNNSVGRQIGEYIIDNSLSTEPYIVDRLILDAYNRGLLINDEQVEGITPQQLFTPPHGVWDGPLGSMQGNWRDIEFNNPDYSEIPWSGATQVDQWTLEQWDAARDIGWRMIIGAGDAAGDLLSDLHRWAVSDGSQASLAFLAEHVALFVANPLAPFAYNHLVGWISAACPLVLDMDGDGVELTTLAGSNVRFDLGTDGFAERIAWVKPDDALLARDVNGNGRIDDVSELFGGNGQSGFAPLAALDANGDKRVDATDAAYAGLLLWRDANGNGVSEAEELTSLQAENVASISVAPTVVNETNAGNQIKARSTYTRADGTTGRIDDVWLQGDVQASHDMAAETWIPSAHVLGLPLLANYGKAAALGRAMDERPVLAAKAEQLQDLARTGDMAAFMNGFEAFVMDWLNVAPNATLRAGVRSDQLAVLDVLRGTPYQGNPTPIGAMGMASEYRHAIDSMAAKFLAQTSGMDALDSTAASTEILTAFEGLTFSMRGDALIGDVQAAAAKLGAMATVANANNVALALRLLVQTLSEGHADRSLFATAGSTAATALSLTDRAMMKGLAMVETVARPNDAGSFGNMAQLHNGGTANDNIYGYDGDDVIAGGRGDDNIRGGRGDDVYVYRAGDNHDRYEIIRGEGNDRFVTDHAFTSTVFSVDADEKTIRMTFADGGSARVVSVLSDEFKSNITIEFGDGMVLTPHAFTMTAQKSTTGDDRLYGRWDADVIDGGAGNDVIVGGDGADILRGGDGDDRIEAAPSDVLADGGAGDDTLILKGFPGQFNFNMATGQMTVSGASKTWTGFEHVSGGTSGGTITGNDAANHITGDRGSFNINGMGGDDVITGTGWSDVLHGGDGNDRLDGAGYGPDTFRGGLGNDTIIGGSGTDTAIFERPKTSYTISTAPTGGLSITEAETGHVDTVVRIERMVTSDGIVTAIQSPIVLDLDGNGVDLTAMSEGVLFDMDMDGVLDATGWISAGDALLVLDRNGDGVIADGDELSFVSDLQGASTDLQGLAAHDGNADGRIDAMDEIYGTLRLWSDDGDGHHEEGEVLTLAQAGVEWIGLGSEAVAGSVALGENLVFGTGTFGRTGGGTSALADAAFAFAPSDIPAAAFLDPFTDMMGPQVASLTEHADSFHDAGLGWADRVSWLHTEQHRRDMWVHEHLM